MVRVEPLIGEIGGDVAEDLARSLRISLLAERDLDVVEDAFLDDLVGLVLHALHGRLLDVPRVDSRGRQVRERAVGRQLEVARLDRLVAVRLERNERDAEDARDPDAGLARVDRELVRGIPGPAEVRGEHVAQLLQPRRELVGASPLVAALAATEREDRSGIADALERQRRVLGCVGVDGEHRGEIAATERIDHRRRSAVLEQLGEERRREVSPLRLPDLDRARELATVPGDDPRVEVRWRRLAARHDRVQRPGLGREISRRRARTPGERCHQGADHDPSGSDQMQSTRPHGRYASTHPAPSFQRR
ncbi:MAG: hypothetical protein H6Q90_1209 [Deltaproteobacteria bacterium]|nr:hypothetical protein [Deltaproteobacteria bacterium]